MHEISARLLREDGALKRLPFTSPHNVALAIICAQYHTKRGIIVVVVVAYRV